MNQVTVHLLPTKFAADAYMANNFISMAKAIMARGEYVSFEASGMDTVDPEEIFDVSNNPDRQTERNQKYGQHRSLSVGDVVSINGNNYLCGNVGFYEFDL